MNGYFQTRCPRCGNAAWGHPAQAVPCATCGQPVMPPTAQAAPPMQAAMPAYGQAAQGAAPMYGHAAQAAMPNYGQAAQAAMPAQGQAWTAPPAQQAGPAMSIPLPGGFKLPFALGGARGGVSLFKLIGGIVLVIALGVGGMIAKNKFVTPKGMIGYGALGLEKGKPDPDRLMTSLAAPAKKWRSDAIFWSLNYQAVRADGTVDVSKGAEVVYVSPSASASYTKRQRANSVKKFSASARGVNQKGSWGWNDPVKDLEAHPTPKCSIKDVVALLGKQGLTAGKTVRITFDPKFADFYAWRVLGDDPKLDALFSWDDCSPIK